MVELSLSKIPELSKSSIKAGAACLDLLDEHGFEIQGAAWIYSSFLDEWRYYVVTDLVEIDGPRATYGRLEKLFALCFNNRGLMIDDVHLGSPREHVFQVLTTAFNLKSKRRKAGIPTTIQNVKIQPQNGRPYFVEKALLYRLEPSPPTVEVMRKRKKFDKHLRELEQMAAQ
jgi:hypothetical protein